jgi:hypothetical protein
LNQNSEETHSTGTSSQETGRNLVSLPWENIGGPGIPTSDDEGERGKIELEVNNEGQIIPGERWTLDGSR